MGECATGPQPTGLVRWNRPRTVQNTPCRFTSVESDKPPSFRDKRTRSQCATHSSDVETRPLYIHGHGPPHNLSLSLCPLDYACERRFFCLFPVPRWSSALRRLSTSSPTLTLPRSTHPRLVGMHSPFNFLHPPASRSKCGQENVIMSSLHPLLAVTYKLSPLSAQVKNTTSSGYCFMRRRLCA